MVSDRLPRQGLILLAALSLFWGANWPVMKMVLSEVPPLYFRSCCLLLGGVGMLALARLSGVPIKVPSGQWNRVLWLAVFNISGWNALVIIGVSLLPSGRAALLGYTMPLWSMLLSVVFLGDRLSGRTVLGLLLGLAGIVVLMGGSVEGMLQAPLGVLCMILGAWSWAIGVVLFKRIPVTMPTSALTGWMMLAGSLPLLALAIPLETSRLVVPGTGPILGMLYNILVAFMFCYWAWNRIVQMVPVAVSSVSSLSTPLIGVLGGVIFLGEPLGWQEIVASLLILGAVGSVSLRR
jgi:drug/metabolite transporter (DMT)-like permease